jgi:endonuclease/exonuclease/phosphatase family metal-dependent hydrolase
MLNKSDFLNRKPAMAEIRLAKQITNNNKSLKMQDAGRKLADKGGFTWTRGECHSRLDYIFVSETLIRYIVGCEQDWAFSSSDHAAVIQWAPLNGITVNGIIRLLGSNRTRFSSTKKLFGT